MFTEETDCESNTVKFNQEANWGENIQQLQYSHK